MKLETRHILAVHLAKVAGEKASEVVASLERIAEEWPDTRDSYLAAAHELRQAIDIVNTPLAGLARPAKADLRRSA